MTIVPNSMIPTSGGAGGSIYVWATNSSTTTSNTWSSIGTGTRMVLANPGSMVKTKYALGESIKLSLPDGGIFELKPDGSYSINDAAAKVTYAASRHRAFNRFLNCSDLIEEFIDYVGGIGLKKHEILKIPVSLLIAFLVVRAAETDGEPPPAQEMELLSSAPKMLLIEPPPKKILPRCTHCGRFIGGALHSAGLMQCSPEHAAAWFAKKMP